MTPGCSTAEHGHAGLRTLVGEHHGLAVTLTHGGLQLGAVRASLIIHPGRRWRAGCCRRGQRSIRCDVGRSSDRRGQGRVSAGPQAYKVLRVSQHHRRRQECTIHVGLRQRVAGRNGSEP
jgi:hypothetical protein